MNPEIRVSNQAELVNVPGHVLSEIQQAMTLPNPKYLEAVERGRWARNIEPSIRLWEHTPGGIAFPRGWTRQCLVLLERQGIQVDIIDETRELDPIDFQFQGELRDYQERAVSDALRRRFGVISATTGSGKTIMALAAIAERKQPALVLVHNKELLYQWRDRIKTFLDIEAGLIGDGKFDIQQVTVGIINTVKKHLDHLPSHFGHLIVDECHRTPASMFTETVQAFDSKYMLGLSATAYRRDGLTKLIYYTLGDLVHEVDAAELKTNGAVMTPEIDRRITGFNYVYDDDYQDMLTSLTLDQHRNEQISDDVTRQAREREGTVLVVSDRVEHCRALAELIKDNGGLNVSMLTGQTPRKERADIVQAVQDGKVDVLISTLQLIGEGFDCPGLSSLFLATPISFKGRLVQVIGRILRPADGKKPLVVDYRDNLVGVLEYQGKKRDQAYRELVG